MTYTNLLWRKSAVWPNMEKDASYLARVAVAMNVKSCALTVEQIHMRIDEATRYFLNQKKVI
jgi:hypothetical protein